MHGERLASCEPGRANRWKHPREMQRGPDPIAMKPRGNGWVRHKNRRALRAGEPSEIMGRAPKTTRPGWRLAAARRRSVICCCAIPWQWCELDPAIGSTNCSVL
jgi:hypothetical protein